MTPGDGRPQKTERVLRLFVPPEDKPTVPGYWDFSQKTLVAGLWPWITADQWKGRRFTITKVKGPIVPQFLLSVEPPPPGQV